jgi:hypothetical protein
MYYRPSPLAFGCARRRKTIDVCLRSSQCLSEEVLNGTLNIPRMPMSIDSLRRHLLQDSAWDGVGENFAISKGMKRIIFIRQDQCRNRDARPVFLLSK